MGKNRTREVANELIGKIEQLQAENKRLKVAFEEIHITMPKPPKCETCGKDLQCRGILWLRHFH